MNDRSRKLTRQVERETRSNIRTLNRNRAELEKEEKMLIAEIKKYAHLGDKATCAQLAKQLLSVRKTIGQNRRMTSEVGQLTSHTRMMTAQQCLMGSAEGTCKAMRTLNKELDTKALGKNAQDFQKAMLELGQKEEIMDDLMESLDLGDVDAEDNVIDEVLSSLEINVSEQLDKARVPGRKVDTGEESAEFKDLMKELEKLH